MRGLTAIFNERKWKTRKASPKNRGYDKNPEHLSINRISPTLVSNLVTVIWQDEPMNAKMDWLIKWSIMSIFNGTDPPQSNLSAIVRQLLSLTRLRMIWKTYGRINNGVCLSLAHDYVTKWNFFPRHWPFVRGILRASVLQLIQVYYWHTQVFFILI